MFVMVWGGDDEVRYSGVRREDEPTTAQQNPTKIEASSPSNVWELSRRNSLKKHPSQAVDISWLRGGVVFQHQVHPSTVETRNGRTHPCLLRYEVTPNGVRGLEYLVGSETSASAADL